MQIQGEPNPDDPGPAFRDARLGRPLPLASGRGRDGISIPETYRHFSGAAPSQRRGDSCFIPETYRHFSRSETYRQFESSQRRTDILEPWFSTPGHPRHVPTFCRPPVEIPETSQHFTSHPRHVPTFLAASRGIPETSQHFHAAPEPSETRPDIFA